MIRDLWRAWKEVRNKRHLAKESLKLVDTLCRSIKETEDKISKCFDDLGKIYSYLPQDDRSDHVKKTLDLLNFSGPKRTAYSFYERLYEYIKYWRKNAYDNWNTGNYEKVVEICG